MSESEPTYCHRCKAWHAPDDACFGVVSLPVKLASDLLEELYELRSERSWWKDEPRCNYQRDYNRLCDEINALEAILGKLG